MQHSTRRPISVVGRTQRHSSRCVEVQQPIKTQNTPQTGTLKSKSYKVHIDSILRLNSGFSPLFPREAAIAVKDRQAQVAFTPNAIRSLRIPLVFHVHDRLPI